MGLMAAASGSALAAAPAENKPKAKIALQMYTMREPAKEDLPGTLKKVREMGWEYVQWSGMPDLPADKIRAELDKAGLKAIAAHVGVEPFEADFDAQVKFWKTVGVEYVGPGGMMGDCKDSLEGWLRGSKRLDTLGEKLYKTGMRLTYHNHAGEFEKFEGDPRCKEDILMETASPKNVCAELDICWVHAGGADPAAYMRKFKDRCPTIHAKDYAEPTKERDHPFVPLGKGILNWKDIFAAGREAGVEWYIYEQDRCDEGPFVAAKESYEFLVKNLT
jgi:sugar phosphate isomerase/epimerase